mmetsp:Transcript_46779/g.111336  ORF Transcript_46779/g.111336 Transcript_46779/m.111336 type:complete len:540 (-) Transcript_46779:259-1878(-)
MLASMSTSRPGSLATLALALFLAGGVPQVSSGGITAPALVRRLTAMENVVLGLAKEVEDAFEIHHASCTDSMGASCAGTLLSGCASALPSPVCDGSGPSMEACGIDSGCGQRVDYSCSNVRVPDGADLLTSIVPLEVGAASVDSLCWQQRLVPVFRQQIASFRQDTDFEGAIPSIYFSGVDGTFIISPARHRKSCGDYDPRVRPWYVAASSGPKDVVLVLDVSGSMSGTGLSVAKKAATRIISALTIGDHFAIVAFSDPVQFQSGATLQRATSEAKEKASRDVEGLTAVGGTNFLAAFQTTFSILDQSVVDEASSGCSKAILFLTDGKTNSPEAEVMGLIESRNRAHQAIIFSYSLGDQADDLMPKRMACENRGVWAAVPHAENLADSMGAYHKLFASGLGGAENAAFTAWVEPYMFASRGWTGTSVSAPVYDRAQVPRVCRRLIRISPRGTGGVVSGEVPCRPAQQLHVQGAAGRCMRGGHQSPPVLRLRGSPQPRAKKVPREHLPGRAGGVGPGRAVVLPVPPSGARRLQEAGVLLA